MVVRIRFARGPIVKKARGGTRRAAGAAGALLALPTVMAVALAVWDITSRFNWTSRFAITAGIFSHWATWAAAATLLQLLARMLSRYSRGEGPT